MAQPFQVTASEAKKFSEVWRYKGLVMPVTDEWCEFAANFAQVTLNSFIAICQAQAQQSKQAEQLSKKKELVVEGV
jgi:hypothetical protein